MIALTVNGEVEEFEEAPTIEGLLERLHVPAGAVAVEVNRVIVPRSAHGAWRLGAGDDVEVLTFVGGG
ncbi:MAG TPA: sulfur carrier protein ThiS, partial [Planctomycetota bacterium]|nr:sulfur carrier protein ThiS [Planctomycetota bacterium]